MLSKKNTRLDGGNDTSADNLRSQWTTGTKSIESVSDNLSQVQAYHTVKMKCTITITYR